MATLINQRIAEKIKAARIMRNYSRAYMANELHVSPNTYSKSEQGASPLKLDRLLSLAEILNMRVVDLIT